MSADGPGLETEALLTWPLPLLGAAGPLLVNSETAVAKLYIYKQIFFKGRFSFILKKRIFFEQKKVANFGLFRRKKREEKKGRNVNLRFKE